jgi:putative pyrroloquinoline-quinone binding quinoprotein
VSVRRCALAVTLAFMTIAGSAGVAQATPGAKIWGDRYNGPKDRADQSYAVAVSPDGSTVYVTGASVGLTSGADLTTVAYDSSNGNRRWTSRYNGPGNRADQGLAVAVSADGSRVFVTGSSVGSAGDPDYATLAYDTSNGDRLWARRHAGAAGGDDTPAAIAVTPDGSEVVVTGKSIGGTPSWDFATIVYDTSSGAKIWAKRYNGPAHSDDLANDLALSPDGSVVYVTGQSAGSPAIYDMVTIAYDTTGTPLWTARYDDPETADDAANAIVVSPDGSTVFVSGWGRVLGSDSDFDYSTVAFDSSTGTDLWATRYDGPAGTYDLANAIGLTPDGSTVLVTGQSYGLADHYEYATLAYDASTGGRQWARRYTGPDNIDDFASALVVGPDGSQVFVTGTSYGFMTDPDFATVGYAVATGDKLWAKRYDGPASADDRAKGIAISPDGSAVYVTGPSFGSNGFDFATLAYSTV